MVNYKVGFYCLLGSFLVTVGFCLYFVLQLRNIEDENFVLPKEFYECVVGFIPANPELPRVCIDYRLKGFNPNEIPSNRHRDHNIEQRKSVRPNEQIVRNIMENKRLWRRIQN